MQTLGVSFVDSPAHSVAVVLVMVERKAVLDDILRKKRRRVRNYLTKFRNVSSCRQGNARTDSDFENLAGIAVQKITPQSDTSSSPDPLLSPRKTANRPPELFRLRHVLALHWDTVNRSPLGGKKLGSKTVRSHYSRYFGRRHDFRPLQGQRTLATVATWLSAE